MIIDCVLCIVLSCFRKEVKSYLLSRRARTKRRARKKKAYDAIFLIVNVNNNSFQTFNNLNSLTFINNIIISENNNVSDNDEKKENNNMLKSINKRRI